MDDRRISINKCPGYPQSENAKVIFIFVSLDGALIKLFQQKGLNKAISAKSS